jgi:hypothetical protein
MARFGWVVLLAALVAFGVAEWFAGAPPGGTVPSRVLEEAEQDEGLQIAYGLTPVDLGFLAEAVMGREKPYVVAGYPGAYGSGEPTPNGPTLSRHPNPERLLADDGDSRSALEPVEGRWKRFVRSGGPEKRRPNLAATTVTVRTDDSERPCPRLGLHRHRCAGPKWAEIRRRRLEIGGSTQRCIWAHPLGDRTIVFDFGSVDPAGVDDGEYLLQTGLADNVAEGGASVEVAIVRGDSTVEHSHAAEKGWQQKRIPRADGRVPLKLEIASEDIGQRHFCFRIRGG